MKFLKTTALALALLASCATTYPAMATTSPSNDGGFINAAVTDAVASYVAGAKGVVKGVAIWSASGARFWDPLVDSGTGGGASPWTPDNASLTTAAPTGTSGLSTAFSGSGTVVYIKNIGAVGVHFRPVLTSGTALVTDERLQPGMCGAVARGTADRLALITDSGTGSVEITTGTGNPGFGLCVDMSAASITNPWALYASWGSTVLNLTSSTTATDCTGTPSAGVTRNVAAVTINNHAATDTVVSIFDADGTTLRWEGTAKANDQRGIVLPGPIKGAATAALFKCKTTTSTGSGGVTFTVDWFDK